MFHLRYRKEVLAGIAKKATVDIVASCTCVFRQCCYCFFLASFRKDVSWGLPFESSRMDGKTTSQQSAKFRP